MNYLKCAEEIEDRVLAALDDGAALTKEQIAEIIKTWNTRFTPPQPIDADEERRLRTMANSFIRFVGGSVLDEYVVVKMLTEAIQPWRSWVADLTKIAKAYTAEIDQLRSDIQRKEVVKHSGFPLTVEEVKQFMREYDAGKYPLSKEDEAALERSRPKLIERLKALSQPTPPAQDK